MSSSPQLSFAQERLWLLQQVFPESAAYNVTRLLRVQTDLDPSALARALNALVARHEVLRTTITADEGRPRARVLENASVELRLLDLAGSPEAETAANAEAVALARVPFDLSKDVLLRAALIRTDVREHLLVLVTHHVASDEGSRGLLVSDLDALYRAELESAPSPLPPLPLQYADHAADQRRRVEGAALERGLAYWREQLAAAPRGIDLPADRPRPSAPTFAGAREATVLPVELLESLQSLARKQRVTLFMTLLAAFVAVLHRYTRERDLVVGTAISGRNRPELEPLIGLFLNNLALRIDVDPDQSFSMLLDRVRTIAIEGYEHQDVPFERVVEEVNPGRDLARSPLFQVAFTLEGASTRAVSFAGVEAEVGGLDAGVTKYDLALVTAAREDGLHALVEYSSDLFDVETVRRFLRHYEMLLRDVAERPDVALADLTLLSGDERRDVLETWNETADTYPQESLDSLVVAQARRTPKRIAVAGAGEALSFSELDRRSDLLAGYLRSLGVAEGTLVGICLERTPRLLTCLLAILRAGGAYVPIDPAYPQTRQAMMLSDSCAPVVLTEAQLAPTLPETDADIVLVDAGWDAIEGAGLTAPVLDDDPERLAYVIYTSGSTGRPKGVEIPHRALVNFLWSMRAEPGLEEEDVLVAVTTLSFDIAGLELWLPLVTGARCVLATAAEAAEPRALVDLLRASRATVMQATPTTWRMLVESGWDGLPSVKALCGGEALPVELAEQLVERGLKLWNMYGPTETTIWSACDRVSAGERPTLGQPLRNTQLYVVDERRQPVPVGVAGELLIGGDGVAAGYRDLPELTAEKFTANPFLHGGRVYHTGDLVRRRPDGRVEFLGRLDQQVKVRGFRIELGEIETRLALHDDVAAVVCSVFTGGVEDRLVAYVRRSGTAGAAELRRFVAETLPAYMVPAHIEFVDAFPLTPNGKVDRAALPAPGTERQREEELVAPRTALEEELCSIWQDVLAVAPIGVLDDFFELGGTSLLAVLMAARVQTALGIDLAVARVFEHSTIAELAQSLSDDLIRHESDDELAALLAEVEAVTE
jgi:amino acid adenylation domain-containing protein